MSPSSPASKTRIRMRMRGQQAYLLFEVILALVVFSFAMVGLAVQLERGIGASGKLERDRRVRVALEAVLNEAKEQGLSGMVTDSVDERLGVTFTTRLEPHVLENAEGESLDDLYILRGTATWIEGNEEISEVAELTLYRPDE